MAKRQQLKIGERTVAVTSLDKILYPEAGFTKAQVIDYYIRVSEYLLPHFQDRPVTLKRYPDGAGSQFFYEKDAPAFTPKWVKTFPVPRRAGGPDIHYVLINDLATLVWCANAASLELHPFLHRVPEIQRPTSVVFDLDPGEGANVVTCAEVALLLRDVLSRLGLESFPKVSGSKGIQIYVPLNTAITYAETQPFARAIAELLAKEHPDLIVAEMAKIERAHKVFIDWSQNADFKTTVGVYSLRAKTGRPFVSLPVTWDELKNAQTLYWGPDAALERLQRVQDLFAPVLKMKQSLPKSLNEYRRKRNFTKTSEPRGSEVPRASSQGSRKRFVIQKHAASHLHYDFRLEMHGALKSWAVPKGAPYELNQKRLAMVTEDHPIEYLDFEGTIPQGQYGGGTVMVWDIGTYEVVEGNYFKGTLHIFLQGKKLKGDWQFVKDRRGENKNWWLIKIGSAMKPLTANKESTSALSGRTMDQIAADKSAQWHSNRTSVPGLDLDKFPKSPMRFVEPMQSELVAKLPEGENWQYEVKLDGYRALAIKEKGRVELFSRRRNRLNDRFPEIGRALEGLEDGMIVDGEIVALDSAGRPSFSLLQHHKKTDAPPIAFYVFDMLAYRGRDITSLPLQQRRQLLEEALAHVTEPIRPSVVLTASVDDLIAAVKQKGFEGIVAKRFDSRYVPGDRSGHWVKYKINQGQELVIGGYKPSAKNHFESLAVGYYDQERLMFAAKIKTGFTLAIKNEVFSRLHKLEAKTCPFVNLPEPKDARWGKALTAEEMKKYRWLRPKLVAQIEFTNWTSANNLRHAKFIALRDDKDPKDAVREVPKRQ